MPQIKIEMAEVDHEIYVPVRVVTETCMDLTCSLPYELTALGFPDGCDRLRIFEALIAAVKPHSGG